MPAHAQKSKAALTSEINTNWPDNTSQAITPAILRSTVIDIVNSYYDLNGGTSLACAAHQWMAGLPTLSSITCTQPSLGDISGFQTGMPAWLASSAGDVLVNASGSSVIQPGVVTGSKIAANTVADSNIVPGAANTMKGSLNGTTTSDIAITACTLAYQFTQWISGTGWQCGINPVLPSRAIAATLNLSAFASVKTLGYATAGDGGGATFENVGTAPFLDTWFNGTNNQTLVGGSGYTNGTYLGVPLTGGHGVACEAAVIVSGGAVTSVNIAMPCVSYIVGDILSTPNSFIGGTGSGFTYTLTTINGPYASFSDAAGNHWQYVLDQGNFSNPKQFGAKGNWTKSGGDSGAQDGTQYLQATFSFAGINNGNPIGNGGFDGARVILNKGAFLHCGGLYIPEGVEVDGQSVNSSMLKECSAQASVQGITLCDPNAQFGQYGCSLQHMQIYSDAGTGCSGCYEVYSNSAQQHLMLNDIEFTTARGCFKYEIGKGGAANVLTQDVDCEIDQSTTAVDGINFNSSGTQGVFDRWVFGCGSTTCPGAALSITAGSLIFTNANIEGMATGIVENSTSAGDHGIIANITASGCGSGGTVVSFPSGTAAGSVILQNIYPGNCPDTLINGRSGGTNITGWIGTQTAP
jgi:hypothetical protein